MFTDLRPAFRALRAAPIVSGAAILSLALGIGANTAIFSVVDSLLLRRLPVREPERLVLVTRGERGYSSFPAPVVEQIRDRRIFDGVLAWTSEFVDVAERGPRDPAEALWVSGSFFDLLGVPAIVGRTFDEDADSPGGGDGGPVAVLSYRFWQRRFGGAPDAVGSIISVERVRYTIVGVAPPAFFGLEVGLGFDIALPLATASLIRGREPAGASSRRWLNVMARLHPGQTVDSATAAVRAAQPHIREATMPDYARPQDRAAYLRDPMAVVLAPSGTSFLRQLYERPLVVLMIVVALVLLVACVNVANLLLARAAGRRREFGIRLALGASRLRLARLLLAESLLLSAAGAALALVVGYWSSRLLVRQFAVAYMGNPFSGGTPAIALDLALNWRVLGFTIAVALATMMLFGTAPGWFAARVDPIESLAEHGRGRTTRFGRMRAGQMLVAVQVAMSLALLVTAGLFIRSLQVLANLPLGFQPGRVLTIVIDARRSAVEPSARGRLYDRIREAADSAPGVDAAAVSLAIPIGGMARTTIIDVPGVALPPGQDRASHANVVSPGWFSILGTRLIAGRDFDGRDRAGAQPVAIVNQAFAARFMQDPNPLGRMVRQGFPEPLQAAEIVGIVENAVYQSTRETPRPTIYLPFAQAEPAGLSPLLCVVARPIARSAPPARTIAAAISDLDRDLVLTIRPMADRVDATFNHERVLALLSGFFGALGLCLAGLGIYGVAGYAALRRRREIGVRLALGASRDAVVRLLMRRMAVLMSIGVAGGLLLSLWSARFVKALLYRVEPRDAVTFVAASALLLVVGFVAVWLPARRTAAVDPAAVLREG